MYSVRLGLNLAFVVTAETVDSHSQEDISGEGYSVDPEVHRHR